MIESVLEIELADVEGLALLQLEPTQRLAGAKSDMRRRGKVGVRPTTVDDHTETTILFINEKDSDAFSRRAKREVNQRPMIKMLDKGSMVGGSPKGRIAIRLTKIDLG